VHYVSARALVGGLPAERHSEEERPEPESRVLPRLSRSALIADDDPRLAESMARFLRALEWEVDIVHQGAVAVERARARRYDVVLLDLRMPQVDGISVLERLRAEPDPPPVVVLSGYLDVHSTIAALKAGAVEVLEKTVAPSQLMAVLARVRSNVSSPAARTHDELVPEVLGISPAIRLVREQIVNVARYRDMSAMIVGETGTGKELVAQAIHRLSGGDGTLVALNCAAIPDELFESELFGHEPGAFTGAKSPRAGLFEAAGRGTVLLDEVGEMAPSAQAKILRVLETRTFRRVGSNKSLELKARVVSATNRVLRGRADEPLRSDLFFRLAAYTIRTPPLRERMEDVESIARDLLRRFADNHSAAPVELSPRAVEALHAHDWPGNVRELRNVVHFAAMRAHGEVVGVREIAEALHATGFSERSKREPASERAAGNEPRPQQGIRDMERKAIADAYERCGKNLTLAAQELRMPRTTLRDKLKKYGLR
jgi:DNA-binding NtrC family response regulator